MPENSFPDVKPGTYYEAITWAKELGLITGDHKGWFNPNDPIIRAAVTAMFHRYDGIVNARVLELVKAIMAEHLEQEHGQEPEPEPDPDPDPDPDPEPPPPPPPPPPPADGIEVTPATIGVKTSNAKPGDHFILLSGEYPTFTPRSGVQGNPIRFTAQPGAVFNGDGRNQFGNWNGVHDLVTENFELADYIPTDTGVLSMTSCVRLDHLGIKVHDCRSKTPRSGYSNEHALYIAYDSVAVHVIDPDIDGGWRQGMADLGPYLHGGGFHAYRGAPRDCIVRGGSIRGMNYGLMLHAAGSGNLVENVNLSGNRYDGSHPDVSSGWTLRNNAGQ